MLRRGVALLIPVLGLTHCTEPAPAPRAPSLTPPTTAGAACTVRGRVALGTSDVLFLGPSHGATAVASFTGNELDLETTVVALGSDRRVRAAAQSDGFVVSGWIDADAVPFRAAREIAVVDQYASILRGAPIRVIAARAGSVRIEAVYSDFVGLVAEADCTVLAIGPLPRTATVPATGRFVHLRRDLTRLFDAPGGTTLLELRARRPGPTLRVLETRAAASRVVYDQGTRITGWMLNEDLEAGEGPDCDDCYGRGVIDVSDSCPDVDETGGHNHDVDGCRGAVPPPARVEARRDVAIHAFSSADSVVIGSVERGATVYVIDRQAGWGRVRPRELAVTPTPGTDFWVDLGELEGARPSRAP